jgi:nondiscriminating glutamyl-tRNA synthetase
MRGPYGPYRQMERLARVRRRSDRLLAADQAYYCYCTPPSSTPSASARRRPSCRRATVGRCAHLTAAERAAFEAEGRRRAIRFRIEPGVVAFDDLVRGHVEIDASALGGDLVIVRADGTPLYHFTVVVDDAAMKISHVIRGEDHLSNTPKHILLFRALG